MLMNGKINLIRLNILNVNSPRIKKRFGIRLIIWTLTLLLFISVSHAEIYKWTDENGQIHYGERPNNPNTEKIEIKSTAPKPDAGIDSDRKEKQRKLLEAFEAERAEKKQEKEKAEKEKRELKRNCAYLKDHYKNLKRTNIYYDFDEDGNRIYLDESIQEQDIAEAEKLIRKHCK